jgi:hypothetical protein
VICLEPTTWEASGEWNKQPSYAVVHHYSFRNVAKARAKDSTGRIQKGFFGRRRLDLLSKGIANYQWQLNSHPVEDAGEMERSNIDLAHARQKAKILPHLSNFIPSPTRSLCTPKRSGSTFKHQCSSGGSSSQRPKVLDALDTSDRE